MTLVNPNDVPDVRGMALMIADCPAFRSAVKAADQDAALNFICEHSAFESELTDPKGSTINEVPPRAIVCDHEEFGHHEIQKTSVHAYTCVLSHNVSLELYVPEEFAIEGLRNQWRWFRKTTDDIKRQMLERSGKGEGVPTKTFPNIERIVLAEGPNRMDNAEYRIADPEAAGPSSLWFLSWRVILK